MDVHRCFLVIVAVESGALLSTTPIAQSSEHRGMSPPAHERAQITSIKRKRSARGGDVESAGAAITSDRWGV
jgi:hypothetical protein